jgi:hypothetical protein
MLFCPAALRLSSRTLSYTAGVIRRHRGQIGSCSRKLNPAEPANAQVKSFAPCLVGSPD